MKSNLKSSTDEPIKVSKAIEYNFSNQFANNLNGLNLDSYEFEMNFQDCETCAEDIVKAVEDCAHVPPDDQHALLKCIEDCLITTADCIECICEIMGEVIGIDIEPCHPGQE